MAYALVVATSKGGNTNQTITTDAVNTTGADLIVINVGYYSGTTPTIAPSDSKGNTWTALTAHNQVSTLVGNRMFYCAAPTVGSGHTFTQEDLVANAYPSIQMLAFSGAHASPFDQQTGAVSSGSASTLATGSLTPSEDNCLVVAGLGHEVNSAGAVSINGGFTATTEAYVGSTSEGSGCAYLIQTSAASANPTWNVTNNTGIAATLATFKAAATASAALTGTATASITESDIVAGGKTLIITLSGDTFIA